MTMRTLKSAVSGSRASERGRKPYWLALAAMVVAAGIWLIWPDIEQPRGSSIAPYHVMSAQEMAPAIFTAAILGMALYRLIIEWPSSQRNGRVNS